MIRPAALPFVLVVLVACVGDDTSGSSGSSGTSGTSGTSGNAGTPGAIVCNTETECSAGQLCCGTGMDWLKVSCKASCAGAYQLQCDDRSDCPMGNVCCMVTDGGARATDSFCKTACTAANEQQLCKLGVSGECSGTMTCERLNSFAPNGLAKCK